MKVTDYQHEGWCDTQNNISNSCNCIVGYPLEVIEDYEEALKAIRSEVGTSTKAWKIANDVLVDHASR